MTSVVEVGITDFINELSFSSRYRTVSTSRSQAGILNLLLVTTIRYSASFYFLFLFSPVFWSVTFGQKRRIVGILFFL